jgi:hypothetical protein
MAEEVATMSSSPAFAVTGALMLPPIISVRRRRPEATKMHAIDVEIYSDNSDDSVHSDHSDHSDYSA